MLARRSSGAAGSFGLREGRAGKGGGWIVWTAENRSVPGGAAGAHSAHNAGAGALAPAPALVLRALRARQTPPPPRRNPTTPANPLRQRTSAGPLRRVFHQRQKGNEKTRPFVQPSPATSTTRKKVVAIASRCETATPRRQQPLPSRATASGRQQSLLRGYRRARSTNRAGERERAFFRGAGHTKRWQEGSRQRLLPFGKAAAHALRAAAASSAPPRAAAAGQPHPLLRDARCPRRAPVARRSLPA